MSVDNPHPAAREPAAGTAVRPPRPGPAAALRGKVEMYRTLMSIPDNGAVGTWTVLSPLVSQAPKALPLVGDRYRRRRSALYEQDMRLLNDVLASSPIAGRYWVWSGLLLGWAREGRVLSHDVGDADLGVEAEDADLLLRAEEHLVAAGFHRWFCFRNRAGRLTQRVVVRHGFRFEFFLMDNVGEGLQEFHVYGPGRSGPVELAGDLPKQELEPFEFLGRKWMKPRDHELWLRTCYGDWRTPDPSWGMFDDRSLVAHRSWVPGADGAG